MFKNLKITSMIIGATIIASFSLSGCADSNLENANLKIENAKDCIDIFNNGDFKLKEEQYSSIKSEQKVIFNGQTCLLLTKLIDSLNGNSTHIIDDMLTHEEKLRFDRSLNPDEVSGDVDTLDEGMKKIEEYGFKLYK
ncbi:MAG: hypothetical protein NTZ80_02650 [Patescibacteria group bacterium]|nr:hypothetical protein [Patescibacteria group bacterium]